MSMMNFKFFCFLFLFLHYTQITEYVHLTNMRGNKIIIIKLSYMILITNVAQLKLPSTTFLNARDGQIREEILNDTLKYCTPSLN